MANETDQQRQDARAKAEAAAQDGDWLSQILGHHKQIEAAVGAAQSAAAGEARTAALKTLVAVLTGHAIAEESVIYPAIAQAAGAEADAKAAYAEQAEAKMAMAALEAIDPTTDAWLDKLAHIKAAVQHHVFEEESQWLLELKQKAPASVQTKLGQAYKEQFERYMGADAQDGAAWERASSAMAEARPPAFL